MGPTMRGVLIAASVGLALAGGCDKKKAADPPAPAPAPAPAAAPAAAVSPGPTRDLGPTLSEAELAPKVEQYIELYEKVAELFVASKDDCSVLARSINDALVTKRDFLAESHALRNNPANRKAGGEIFEKLKPRMLAAEMKMTSAGVACKDDQDVVAAMSKLVM
jgi:hypothetical protein